jgi:hypothetical protein
VTLLLENGQVAQSVRWSHRGLQPSVMALDPQFLHVGSRTGDEPLTKAEQVAGLTERHRRREAASPSPERPRRGINEAPMTGMRPELSHPVLPLLLPQKPEQGLEHLLLCDFFFGGV